MTANWDALGDLLSQSSTDRGVVQIYPQSDTRLSLIAAAASADVASSPSEHAHGQQLSERLAALVAQSRTITQIGNCPVVGITGLLNSGKSSLLAAYLSSAGRRRVLRGTANNQGTHRFVLWLPDMWWNEPELLGVLRTYLAQLFGYPPEELSDQPAQAFAQYNGEVLNKVKAIDNVEEKEKLDPSNRRSAATMQLDPLCIPLIAHDPGLDELGLALLDCPDIQTAFAIGAFSGANQDMGAADADETQQKRRRQLSRVGRLCSAFVVVSKLSSLHDETLLAILETLKDTMPGVRRILAVNKVKARYAPEVVDEQARQLVSRFQIADVYMAYDFRSHWAEYRLPSKPQNLEFEPQDPLPIFFRAAARDHAAITNAPRGSLPNTDVALRPPVVEHYLQDLSKLLAPGSLVIEGRRSVLEQLDQKVHETQVWFESNQAQRRRQLHHAWQAIADACFAFMAQRDASNQAIGLRLQTSPTIVAQMSDSLVRAAPWSMRPSLAIDRSVRQLQSSIADSVKRVRWLHSASANVSQFVGRFRQGDAGKIVTADRFREQLERSDKHSALANCSTESLNEACEHALKRFKQEDTVRLNSEWLDRWSAELWKHMSLKRKLYVGMMPLAPIFGPLLAVTLIPFDGGGTAVLVFATTKELLLAAGITALAVPTTLGSEVQDIVESETALTQLSELFAVSCDSLGLPRPSPEQLPRIMLAGQPRDLSPSQLAVKAAATKCVLSVWQLATNYAKTLNASIGALRTEIEKQNENAS